ncbi:MAG: VCBS repeat-containing protein [Candidatus Moduliflexus flocculans]|nr:VCBS repeat-containing protein [Candidatus Moduliflexus flocculans]
MANFGVNSIAVLENDGTGIFISSGTIAGQLNVSALAAGDWGGDGALDLAAANQGADSVDVLKNRLP